MVLRMTLIFSMASNCQPYRFYYHPAVVVCMPATAPKKKAFRKEATIEKQIVLTFRSQQEIPSSFWFCFP
jgi:hypothetical protein